MGIKAISYENLEEGDLITWYGVHVLRWEDDIRPYGIEPTMAFVQDDTLEQKIADLLEVLKPFALQADGLSKDIPDDNAVKIWVSALVLREAEQAIARAEGDA